MEKFELFTIILEKLNLLQVNCDNQIDMLGHHLDIAPGIWTFFRFQIYKVQKTLEPIQKIAKEKKNDAPSKLFVTKYNQLIKTFERLDDEKKKLI